MTRLAPEINSSPGPQDLPAGQSIAGRALHVDEIGAT